MEPSGTPQEVAVSTPAPGESRTARAAGYSNALNPAMSLGGLFLFGAPVDASKPSVGLDDLGRIVPVEGETMGADLQEAELAITSVVDPFWEFTGKLIFPGGEGVEVEEIFAINRSVPGLELKAGRMKARFGKHGLLHAHAFPFIAAPLAYEAIVGGEGYGDVGLEASWLTALPWFFEVTAGAYNGAGPEGGHDGLDLAGAARSDLAYLGHVKNFFELGSDGGIELGGSALAGRGSDGLGRGAWGLDLTVKTLPPRTVGQAFVAQAEWLQKVVRNAGANSDAERGWYASVLWRFARGWWTGARVERVTRSEVETAAFVPLDADMDTVQDTDADGVPLFEAVDVDVEVDAHDWLALNLVWAPSEFSAIRAEASYGRLETAAGTALDRRVYLQLIYFIGAHPAHEF